MVALGRICCIAAPFALSLAVLICMILVFLAGNYDENSTLNDLYFVKIDLQNLTITNDTSLLGDSSSNSVLEGALQVARDTLGVSDFYTVYLRGYCHWNDGQRAYANCSNPQANFWFDPVRVWNLNDTGVDIDSVLPDSLSNSLDIYRSASKAVFYLYVGSITAAAVTLLVGITAIFSRWGSFFTTFCATAMWVLLVGASATVTAVNTIVRTALNEALEDDYGVSSSIGTNFLSLTWIGAAFAIGAGFFWFLSVCCCSGRSPYNKDSHGGGKRTRAEKTPYTYERVGSPYLGHQSGQNVPMSNFGPGSNSAQRGTAYEPFRPQQV